MTVKSINVFEKTITKSNEWLNDVSSELDWDDPDKSYKALRSVLHFLRDCLTVQEAADFGAQMPMLIRGLYFEGWRPTGKPVKHQKRADFVQFVNGHFTEDDYIEDEDIIRGVFNVLRSHVTAGEIDDIIGCLAKDIQPLWRD
jgi:uncharacterized protein (DUF2267 family)